MYNLYQNKYANKLHQNIIKVKYADNHILRDKDFAIRLNNNTIEANDLITFKLYLYLGTILTQNALNDEILILDTKILDNALKIGKKRYVISSLEYLKAIEFKYFYYKGKNKANKWLIEERSCKIIDDYTSSKGIIKVKVNKDYLTLLGYGKMLIKLPQELFRLDIKKYHHSLFMGFRILLHRQVNYSKKQRDIISVKEIIKYCPLLPTYDELGKQKQITRNIYEPFKNNMDYLLNQLGFKWKYESNITTYISFINNKIVLESNN